VLDAAGYGAVTITKGNSIVNDGVGVAGIQTVPGVNGVTINAGANDSVHLRGLLIEGLGVGTNGILFNTGRNLAIESVSNTISSDSPGNGITIAPTGAAAVTDVLSKVAANNNGLGFLVIGASTTGALNVTIVDSEASNNFVSGVGAFSRATAMLRNFVASYNSVGLSADANAILRVAHSVVTGNNTGVNTSSGGVINSYGDNDIDGNTNNNTGTLTSLAMH
jgi:hypothetical protein